MHLNETFIASEPAFNPQAAYRKSRFSQRGATHTHLLMYQPASYLVKQLAQEICLYMFDERSRDHHLLAVVSPDQMHQMACLFSDFQPHFLP